MLIKSRNPNRNANPLLPPHPLLPHPPPLYGLQQPLLFQFHPLQLLAPPPGVPLPVTGSILKFKKNHTASATSTASVLAASSAAFFAACSAIVLKA